MDNFYLALSYSTPSPNLLRELEDVSEKANLLAEYLSMANLLPPDLPVGRLSALCLSLSELKNGTAEGCREPLIYARKRLPAFRREYLAEQNSPKLKSDEPQISRGEELDRRLSELAIAVVTALDQYQADANETIPEGIQTERPLDPRGIGGLTTTVNKSGDLEREISSARAEFKDLQVTGSDGAVSFERQISDVETHNRLARTELSMPAPRSSWMRPIAMKLSHLPTAIRATGNGLRVGVDIATPLIHRWNDLWSNFTDFILVEISNTGEAIANMADQLENALDKSTVSKKGKISSKVFIPRSTPDGAFRVLHKLLEIVEMPIGKEALEKEFGHSEIRDLVALGYLKRKRNAPPTLTISEPISKLAFKNRAATVPAIVTTRNVLVENQDASSDEIIAAVSQNTGKTWASDSTIRRNGNALRRWVVWLEPHLLDQEQSSKAYSYVQRSLGQQVKRGGLRKIFGEKEQRLRELLDQGMQVPQIAEELGLFKGTIYNWQSRQRKKAKGPIVKWSKSEDNQ